MQEPLLNESDKKVNMTITSMDSALSNSEIGSDIEMDTMTEKSDKPRPN